MNEISTGFQTTSNEIVLFLILLGTIVIGLIFAQIFRKKAEKKAGEKRAKSPKTPILRSYSAPARAEPTLGSKEQNTLDHLAWLLKEPAKKDKLLHDDALLLRVARQAIREGVVNELEVIRLLRRLNVDTQVLKPERKQSSGTIPTGAEVSVSTAAMAMGTGELLLSTDSALQARIDKGASNFKAGDQVDVVCYSSAGMHQFHTTVVSVDGKTMNLRHTPHVRHAQRRRYRRRKITIPVSVTLPGVSAKPLNTMTLDLSIGGMAIKNPRKKLVTGAYTESSLDIGSSGPLNVGGTVIRLSRRGKTAHITFSGVDEKTRHRLFRRLLRSG